MNESVLYLCEKPAQAYDIAKVLNARQRQTGYLVGENIIVTWCLGHLLTQAEPEAYGDEYKRWRLETLPILPQEWKLEVKKSSSKQYHIIKQLLRQTQHVVIATDADREGEMIAREVLVRCAYHGKLSRLWLSALDEDSIRKALSQLKTGQQTEALYQAGLARSRADWLVGMNLTRAFSVAHRQLGHKGILSVGRVQTPTLRLVVDRDESIAHFVPVDYWEVIADCQAKQVAERFKAQWQPNPAEDWVDEEGRCLLQAQANEVATDCQGRIAKVTHYSKQRKRQAAPLPYDLSSLQVEISKRRGLSAQQVLDTAQSLYETHKLITYPRTDCMYLPPSQHKEAEAVLQAVKSVDDIMSALVTHADTRLKSRAWNNEKITAHHAIIPTTATTAIAQLSKQELWVYDLIRRRYLAQFYPAYEYDQTTIELECLQQRFRSQGRVSQVQGWKAVYNIENKTEEAEQQHLPALSIGDEVVLVTTTCLQRQTKPPQAFTEGSLIQAMKHIAKQVVDEKLKAILKENKGIGTEATRANIIETLLARELIAYQDKTQHLYATKKGVDLIRLLPNSVKDPVMTAVWEQALEAIANGALSSEVFMAKQQRWLIKAIDFARQQAGVQESASHFPSCPQCGKVMLSRVGQYGAFWGCSAYPRCKATLKRNPVS